MTTSLGVIATLLGLGLFAGVLSGMFGIGGGLVIVPVLVIFLGLSQKEATGTSLFALLLPVGLLGVLEYWRRDEAKLQYGLLIAAGLFIGAYFGARITHGVSDLTLKRIYAAFLIVVAGWYLFLTTESGQKIIPPKVPPARKAGPAPEGVGPGEAIRQ